MTATLHTAPVTIPDTTDQRVVRRRLGPGHRIRFSFWFGPALALAIWSIGSATGLIKPAILSAPWDVVVAFQDQWVNHDLLGNIVASLQRSLVGLTLGVVTGAVLAVISGLSRFGESLIDGPIQIKRSVPTLAIIPLFIAWFGIGEEMKVITIALISLVPIYIHTHNGLRGIDGKYAELAETIGINHGEFIRHVVLPGALPGFLLGMRFAVTSSLLGLVVVEHYNAVAGIGYMITLAEQYGQTDVIVVGLVIYGIFGYCADSAVRFTGRRVLAWRQTLEG